jgi:guanylate kinase
VAAACLQMNSQERLKPVLEAFGILGSNGGQQQLDFGDDSKDEDDEPMDDFRVGGQGKL